MFIPFFDDLQNSGSELQSVNEAPVSNTPLTPQCPIHHTEVGKSVDCNVDFRLQRASLPVTHTLTPKRRAGRGAEQTEIDKCSELQIPKVSLLSSESSRCAKQLALQCQPEISARKNSSRRKLKLLKNKVNVGQLGLVETYFCSQLNLIFLCRTALITSSLSWFHFTAPNR